jgi:hypothetical protein
MHHRRVVSVKKRRVQVMLGTATIPHDQNYLSLVMVWIYSVSDQANARWTNEPAVGGSEQSQSS